MARLKVSRRLVPRYSVFAMEDLFYEVTELFEVQAQRAPGVIQNIPRPGQVGELALRGVGRSGDRGVM